jgi:hypothetical protein
MSDEKGEGFSDAYDDEFEEDGVEEVGPIGAGEVEIAPLSASIVQETLGHEPLVYNKRTTAFERERKQAYNKYGVRGPTTLQPGKTYSVIEKQIEVARQLPGPGQYVLSASIGLQKASAFTKGLRIDSKIDDEEGVYLDPLHSTTLSKQGACISPSNNARDFTRWDEKKVGQWLSRIGLAHLASRFVRENVQGKDLYDMTPDDLQDVLRIDAFADRKRLVKELSVRCLSDPF